eukprot:g7025.t2
MKDAHGYMRTLEEGWHLGVVHQVSRAGGEVRSYHVNFVELERRFNLSLLLSKHCTEVEGPPGSWQNQEPQSNSQYLLEANIPASSRNAGQYPPRPSRVPMNGHSDTSDNAPLNSQAAVDGSYGSTLTSGRAPVSHPSDASHTRLFDGRANGSPRNTSADASQLQRLGSRIPRCIDAVDDGLEKMLRWGENNWLSLVDVALIVAGMSVLVRHRQDEAIICPEGHGTEHETEGYKFSYIWRRWALVAVVLKILITGGRWGTWVLERQGENLEESERGVHTIVGWIQNIWFFIGMWTVVHMDLKSCDGGVDDPIFQLCLVTLITSVITFSIGVLVGPEPGFTLRRLRRLLDDRQRPVSSDCVDMRMARNSSCPVSREPLGEGLA